MSLSNQGVSIRTIQHRCLADARAGTNPERARSAWIAEGKRGRIGVRCLQCLSRSGNLDA
jgi:hypothetical protein